MVDRVVRLHKSSQLFLYSFLTAVPPSIAQEMAMRLLYLGFILCLEITSPHGATVGKKACCVILHCESMTTFFPPPPCLQSICAQACAHQSWSQHRKWVVFTITQCATAAVPLKKGQDRSLEKAFNHRKYRKDKQRADHFLGVKNKQKKSVCVLFFLSSAVLLSGQTEWACEDGRQ